MSLCLTPKVKKGDELAHEQRTRDERNETRAITTPQINCLSSFINASGTEQAGTKKRTENQETHGKELLISHIS